MSILTMPAPPLKDRSPRPHDHSKSEFEDDPQMTQVDENKKFQNLILIHIRIVPLLRGLLRLEQGNRADTARTTSRSPAERGNAVRPAPRPRRTGTESRGPPKTASPRGAGERADHSTRLPDYSVGPF